MGHEAKNVNDLAKLNRSQAFKAHGPQSYLINRLARYGVLGWLLFALMLAVNIILSLVFVLKPDRILTVDNGQLIGEYHESTTRNEGDILGAGVRFVESFYSHNSETVLMDKYNALAMMDEPLYEEWKNIWFDLNVVTEIQNQKVHCVVMVDKENLEFTPHINDTYYFKTHGDIVCGKNNISKQSFDFDFTMVPAAITKNRTAGVKVINLFSKPFEQEKTDAQG